ncbi:hypothetical protein [Actinoplanes sp. NPDC089786]|uniref:hypothetical protein n=1 Tax=Actinoplanes sp. NPDC089786 TaxID=3155185 RepID=UPI00343A9E87
MRMTTTGRVLAGRGWAPTISALYPGHQLVRFGNTMFPATVFPAPGGEDPDSALGDLDLGLIPAEHDADPGRAFRSLGFDPRGEADYREYAGSLAHPGLHDGPTYAAVRIRNTSNGPRIDAKPGSYFASLATAEILEQEFVQTLVADPDHPARMDALPRRAWLHRRLDGADPVLDGRFRAGAMSVAVTILHPAPTGHNALLVRRSAHVRTHPGFLHVAPAGILAPSGVTRTDWREGFSVRQTVLREYAEEMFGYRLETSGAAEVNATVPVRDLVKAIEAGEAELRLTGVSVPLLTLRPEICVLLLVHEPDRCQWLVDGHNWEVGNVVELALDDEFRPATRPSSVDLSDLLPAAAASLHLATESARANQPSAPGHERRST